MTTGRDPKNPSGSDIDAGKTVEKFSAEFAQRAEKVSKASEEFRDNARLTAEAFGESSKICYIGTQEILRKIAKSGESLASESILGFRDVVGAKTIRESFERQGQLGATLSSKVVSDYSEILLANIELARKACAPINEHNISMYEKIFAKHPD